MRLIESPAVS